MQTKFLGSPGKLSDCAAGELIRVNWGGRDNLAIVVKPVNGGLVVVFLPFGAAEPTVGVAQASSKLVLRYGTDWLLEMIYPQDMSPKATASEVVGSVVRSSTGTHICVLDKTPQSINEPVYVNVEANSFGNPEGPVVETQRWKIWAAPNDCDTPGRFPLYEYQPPAEV
ncbi:hypothetical protein FJ546_10305 [Mesorhizobium sp. B2-4-19]|nr:hypothetical protein FJ546_10305 [Mesorhizobium sp. B2-4-19]